ncbi:MAG: phosphopantothenoylcysteine decarboxylase [Verrucomicrobiales bacterium]|jgi:phosphopantothenoylcysteine decarboxylase
MSDPAKTIILGVTGSIAAFKAADLTSQLVKLGHDVHVVMTASAEEFITPLTLQVLSKNPVTTNLFDEKDSWRPGHIQLADSADLFVVAPATANSIAQFAHGMAGDALSAIGLAIGPRAPWLVAPAMNGHMWQNPATQENVEKLRSRGADFIGPEDGMLACGYEGVGRLWSVEGIVERIQQLLSA